MDAYEMSMVKPTTCIPNFVTSTNEAMDYVGTAIDRNSENFSRSIERLTAGYFTEGGYVQLNEKVDFGAIKEKIKNAFTKLWNAIKNAFEFVLEKIKNLCSMIISKVPDMGIVKKHLAAADPNAQLGDFHSAVKLDDIMKYMGDVKGSVDKQVAMIQEVINVGESTGENTKLGIKALEVPSDANALIVKKMGDAKKVNVSFVASNLQYIYETATNYSANKKRVKSFYDYEYKVIASLQSKVKSCKSLDTESFNKGFTGLSKYMKFATKVGLGLLKASYNDCAKLLRAAAHVKAASNESFYF